MKHHHTINQIIKKLQPTFYTFKYANKLLPTHIMKALYYSHIYPHLILNITVWGTNNSTKTYIQPLIRAQKKAIRLITNKPPRTYTNPIMTELQILNITNLYTRACVEMHPFIHPQKELNRPEHNHSYTPVSQIHNYPTRHSVNNHYFIPNQHSSKQPTHTIEHFQSQYLSVWNQLPLELRCITSKNTFKTKLKAHLLEKQKEQH